VPPVGWRLRSAPNWCARCSCPRLRWRRPRAPSLRTSHGHAELIPFVCWPQPLLAGSWRSRPARLSARTLLASAALTISIVLARFSFVQALSSTRSPNLVAWVNDRHLPLIWSAIPTGTRRRRRIPPPFRRIPGSACLCNACTSVRLCRSLLSFAIHLAPPRNHGIEPHDANETGSCNFTLAPVMYWCERAVCTKISIKTCAFGR
jgi:hypothetical protein